MAIDPNSSLFQSVSVFATPADDTNHAEMPRPVQSPPCPLPAKNKGIILQISAQITSTGSRTFVFQNMFLVFFIYEIFLAQ